MDRFEKVAWVLGMMLGSFLIGLGIGDRVGVNHASIVFKSSIITCAGMNLKDTVIIDCINNAAAMRGIE